VGNPTKEGKGIVCTSSNSRHLVKPISHGPFPLDVLLIRVRKGLLSFFALANADLVDFSSLALAAVAASKAFLEASSSASRDEMRALAAAKASAIRTWKGKSNKAAKKGTQDKQNIGKKITLGSQSSFQILDTFSAQSDKLLHQDLSRKIT
jgi:hypothetical protein